MTDIQKFKESREVFLKDIEAFIRKERKEMEFDKEDKEVTEKIISLITDCCSNIYKFALISEDHIYHKPELAEKVFEKLKGALSGMRTCRCISLHTKNTILKMVKKRNRGKINKEVNDASKKKCYDSKSRRNCREEQQKLQDLPPG